MSGFLGNYQERQESMFDQLRDSVGRWDRFNIAELQQMYAAVRCAEGEEIFGPPGPGNLLPGLSTEIGTALEEAIDREEE